MPTYTFPSPTNTGMLPQLTGQMIAFFTDPAKFAINDYVDYRPAKAMQGLFLRLDPNKPYQVNDLSEFLWAELADRPTSAANAVGIAHGLYNCQRYNLGTPVGQMTIDNATWPLMKADMQSNMTRVMTARTLGALNALELVGNWGANTGTATAINGGFGKWDTASNDPASVNRYAIRKTINAVVKRIQLSSRNVVNRNELRMIIAPDLAEIISATPEIVDYLARSPFAMDQVMGNRANRNMQYGIPESLYGVEVVVESAVRVQGRDGGIQTVGFMKNPDTVVFCTKQSTGIDGGVKASMLDGNTDSDFVGPATGDGSPSATWNYSTLQMYHFGPLLQCEVYPEPRHRRIQIDVTENITFNLAVPESGFLVTDVTAA